MSRRGSGGFANGSKTRVKNVAPESLDIFQHIEEISQVSGSHCTAKFVPVNGPGRGDLERMKHRRRVPRPRNVNLFDDDSDDQRTDPDSSLPDEPFDENAVLAGIRAMNGGMSFSDRSIQQRWDRRVEAKQKSEAKTTRDVFARNVGMRAIMKQKSQKNFEKKINCADDDNATNINDAVENQDDKDVGENYCGFPFVRDSADSDFLFRRVVGSDNRNDDFVVEHVGKITSKSSRQYFIDNYDDSAFVFPRRNE